MRQYDQPVDQGQDDRSVNDKAGRGRDLWKSLATASDTGVFCENWLSLQCRMLPNVKMGLLLLGKPDTGPFTPAAIFPDRSHNVTHLSGPAERALKERQGIVVKIEHDKDDAVPQGYFIAYPVELSGKIHGAVILEVAGVNSIQIQAVVQGLHWGSAWLEIMFRRAESASAGQEKEQLKRALDAIADVVEHEKFHASSMAFVTGLATTLKCDRVSIGFSGRGGISIEALSHSADFGEKTNLLRAIGSAMEEAIDQKSVITYPLPENVGPLVTRDHAELARLHGSSAICTVPLIFGNEAFGALLLERQEDIPFDEATVQLLITVASITGPVLNLKRKEERLLSTKAAEVLAEEYKKLIGPTHFGLKTAVVVAVLALVFFVFAKGDHRVTAPTVLEGIVQRAVEAPFNGYVVEAPARPGDMVRQGVLLCRLDDRDLKLERLKWFTQREQFLKQYSEAMAKHDRAEALINEAKTDQAEAQMQLIDEQLTRARITAPFDGVVTNGDFSQSLGTPVERGQVLFEIAPLKGYRVIVQVDERDIGWIKVGQKGELVLPSVPGTSFPLTVNRITPISTAKEGRNYFRVEAGLQKTSERLRPGMEGIAKINAGRARLIWIWTHEVIEWMRLKIWSFWP